MSSLSNKVSPAVANVKHHPPLLDKLSIATLNDNKLIEEGGNLFQINPNITMEDNMDKQDGSTLNSVKIPSPVTVTNNENILMVDNIYKTNPIIKNTLVQDISRNSSLSKTSGSDNKKSRRRSRYKNATKTKSINSLSAKNSCRTHSSAFELKMAALEEQLQDVTPTNEAIEDINLELKALENNLIDIDSSDSQSFVSGSIVTDNKVPIQSTVAYTKINNKDNNTISHLLRENAELRKKVDKLEFDLSQSKSKLFEGSNTQMSTNEPEDEPIIYTTLKTKLLESQETILKQKEILEQQDEKIQDLERKVNNLSDSLVIDELYKTQSSFAAPLDLDVTNLKHNRYRDSLLVIDDPTDMSMNLTNLSTNGLQDDVKNFVNQLFSHQREKSIGLIQQVKQQAVQSPPLQQDDNLSFTLPIYSLYADESITPLTHSKSLAYRRISRNPSTSNWMKLNGNTKRSLPHLSTSVLDSKGKEEEFDKIKKELIETKEQNKNLNNKIRHQSTQLEANELALNQVKKNNQQSINSLMEQVERLKMEVNSYQFQLQDVTRKNSALGFELEEANNRIISLEEKKTKFLCFN